MFLLVAGPGRTAPALRSLVSGCDASPVGDRTSRRSCLLDVAAVGIGSGDALQPVLRAAWMIFRLARSWSPAASAGHDSPALVFSVLAASFYSGSSGRLLCVFARWARRSGRPSFDLCDSCPDRTPPRLGRPAYGPRARSEVSAPGPHKTLTMRLPLAPCRAYSRPQTPGRAVGGAVA